LQNAAVVKRRASFSSYCALIISISATSIRPAIFTLAHYASHSPLLIIILSCTNSLFFVLSFETSSISSTWSRLHGKSQSTGSSLTQRYCVWLSSTWFAFRIKIIYNCCFICYIVTC
jgi:hypothetical protein